MQKDKKSVKKSKEKFYEELVESVETDFENRRKARLKLERQWELNMNFLVGNQYCDINRRGEIEPVDGGFFWQKKEVYNHIAPIIETRLAKFADISPVFGVKPRTDDDSAVKGAALSEKLLSYVFDKNEVMSTVQRVCVWSETCGTGFYKVVWNNQGGTSVGAVNGEEVFDGEAEVLPVSPFEKGLHLLPYFALALAITFGVRFYISFFRYVEGCFRRARGPLWIKAAAGGMAVGAIACASPGIRGAGYEMVIRFFEYVPKSPPAISWVPLMFFGVFLLKVVATSFTVGSGGSGGVFAPALVCGGTLGMSIGVLFRQTLPEWVGIVPAEFALVGMAGFLASAVRVPLTAVVMVAEISGNHELLMPAMWVCGISFWLNNGWSLYRSQVHARESSPLHA